MNQRIALLLFLIMLAGVWIMIYGFGASQANNNGASVAGAIVFGSALITLAILSKK